jgi:hypothetical protein
MYQEFMSIDQNRISLYNVYDQMDMTDLIGGILDMFAEDSTPVDPRTDRSLWVESKNKMLEGEANQLLVDLAFEEDLTALARDIAKYGDSFDRLVYTQGEGVLAAHSVHPRLVHRREDKVRKLLGFSQDGKKFRRQTSILSWPWDYVHYRLRGRNRDNLYGTSFLYNLIRVWRQLVIAEDYALLYQISRHPDRNLFMIDIGSMDEAEGQRVVRRFKEALRYQLHRDPKRGNYDYRFNPITPIEDMFLGVRPNSGTKVEKLSGSTNYSDSSNLMYYVNKLFATSRVPKTTFGYEGTDVYNPKQSVTNQDIRYAKNAVKLQKAIKWGIRRTIETHFVVRGTFNLQEREVAERRKIIEEAFRRGGNYDFMVKMAPVSYLEELQRLELDQTRWQVTDAMLQSARDHVAFDARSWVAFILKNYARIPDSQLEKVLVKLEKAQDREGYWYGGHGEMPPDQKQAMKAQSAATIAQSQLTVAQADQEMGGAGGEGGQLTPEQMSKMSDAELKKMGASDADIAKIRKMAKEDRDHHGVDPDDLSSEEKELLAEAVQRNPRLQRFIEKARELWSGDEDDEGVRHRTSLEEADQEGLKDDMTDDDIRESDTRNDEE